MLAKQQKLDICNLSFVSVSKLSSQNSAFSKEINKLVLEKIFKFYFYV